MRAVYNLRTADGTFFANGILVHNCDTVAYAARDLASIDTSTRKQKSQGRTVTGGLLTRDL